ncbi:MAG TPA: cytochrome c oxidase assembly protein [Solirubrobacteraceae bacterium]
MSGEPTPAHLLGSWSADPVLIALLLSAAALYLHAARRRARAWPVRRSAAFLAGLLALAVALMSGIDSYAERLLSVHMVQHLLLMLAAPVLLLAGAPVRLALASAPARPRRALVALLRGRPGQTLARPAVTFVPFAAVVCLTHLTGSFELTLEQPVLHQLEHAAYFWTALAFLAPLMAVDPLPHPPGAVARFSWALAAMTAMALPGALLAFSRSVRYPHYIATARALGRSALEDQQLAGAIMWVGGGLALFALAVWMTLSAMAREERRQQRRELHAGDAQAAGR